MKKNLLIFCLLMIISGFSIKLNATTYIYAGNLSTQTWTSAGSPYYVYGNITVLNGATLTVDPGVMVFFVGHYGLFVQGRLLANGTPDNKIYFYGYTSTGWSGIRFNTTPTSNDTSFISSCYILFGNANGGTTTEDQCGGGIFVKSFSKLVVSNCIISNNYAQYYGGGIYCSNSSPIIINNIFCNNQSVSYGGAICVTYYSNPQIISNTIVNNHGGYYSGGIDITSSSPTIKNCIFWGNTATYTPQIYPSYYGNVSYSNIQGGWTGTGNINSDPKFISPSSGSGSSIYGYSSNWGLSSTSPCINSGGLSLPNYLPATDVAGNLRVDYDTLDIGALEYIQSDVLCGAITTTQTLSKYIIISCDVTVNNGVTLTIPAGAKVRFMGPYKLNVNGRLLAVGTFDNLIKFYPASSANPWKGIRFDNTAATNDTSKIEYCVIQNSFATGSGNDVYGGAIFSNYVSKLIVRNNFLTNNRAYSYGGAIACFNGSPFIVCNLIANNTALNYYGGGIYLSSSNSYVINNTITRNYSPYNSTGNGVYVASGTPILRNNIIWRNTYTGGTISNQLYPGTGLNVQYCDIEGGTYSGTGNISTDPSFKSVSAGSGYTYDGFSPDWALQSSSSIINAGSPTNTGYNLPSLDIEGRTRTHGTIDPGAFEDVSSINVCGQINQNTTWNATTVHVTCNVTVKNGVTLTIAAGTKVVFDNYYVLRVNGRLLAVGNPTDTIRFYAINPAIGWQGIRFDSMAYIWPNNNDTSKIMFCRIEHGKTNNSGSPWTSYYGGGFFAYYFNKIILSNSLFTNNNSTSTSGEGAAVGIYYCDPTIRNCTFINNAAYYGGAIYTEQFKGIIENCKFSNNTATYYGGAMYLDGTSNCKIVNTLIVNNTATYGGGVALSYNCAPTIINNTISNNYASNYGGAIYCTSNSDPVIKNCIVWGNNASSSGNQFYLQDLASDPKIYYSDIQGGVTAFGGTGAGANYANIYQNNIDLSPSFTSPTTLVGNGSGSAYYGLTANWRIQLGSPCINLGTSSISGLGLPDYDLAGKNRVYNGRIDMGAYENQQPIYACGTISADKTWEADTIKVTCDILIASGATLTISPGTYVQFQGPYKLEVQGRLLALGTASNMITFSIKDTTYFSRMDSFNRGCWKGIQFNSIPIANDSSKLIFCKISYGKASSSNYYSQRGGGVYIYNSNKVLLSNCYISNNLAGYGGSGIYIESSNPRILNNVVCNNSVKGITGGYPYGGAVYFDDANADFINNTVVNNTGYYYAGLILDNSSAPLIRNCIIYNNIGDYYYQNYGTNYYGDIMVDNSCQPDISNCIFTNYNTVYLYYVSNIQNITYGDPQFVTPTTGLGSSYNGFNADWTLKSTTPCLNAGTPSSGSLHLPDEDLAGKPRIIGDTIDLGAYEIQIHKKFITSQPAAVIACVGTKATFSVSASIAVAYQWQKSGVNISGATNGNFSINSVTESDSGYYRCLMSNQNGNILSDSAKLSVRTLPAVTSNPNPTSSACLGGIVNFSITATGSTPLAFQWYNLNGSVSGGSNSTYSINPVASNSASTYHCVVTNSCGSAVSNGATLTINTPVTVTPITSSNSICVGGTVSMSTLGTGTATITYQWYKNGTAISGATSFTYQITNAQTTHAGNYYCKATNVCRSDSTNTSTLTVNSPPTITYQSPSDSVCAGQSKTFSISANSSLAITYQWYYNNISNAISGATNNIYNINSVASSNGGTYYCKATNSCGTVTTSVINFTVKSAPAISTQSSNLVLCVGQQANFSVTATGTAPLTYKWYKDNTLISGAVSSSYQINSVTSSDAGNYYCIITNSCGSLNSSVKTVTVNTVPTITSQSASDSVCLGQSKSFSITATGSAPITYQWYYNTTSNAITGATNNFYTINAVGTSNGGSYYCKASNSCGDATTSQITLTVKMAPSITTQSSNLVLCAAQQANFSVIATGTTPLTYKWYKDNSLISGAVASTYSISSVTTSDAGNYYCVITNSCGSINSSTKTLTVNTSATITSQSASDSICVGQSKSLSITATGSAPITYQWYYNTTSNAIAGATNNFYNINSAKTSNGGSYYCKATNSCGTATTSQITLIIRTAPTITAQSAGATRCVGQSQNFSVTATGSPTPKYQWYKDDTAIFGATNNIYTISVVAVADGGNYYCVVSNACDDVQSNVKTLTVNTPPDITSQTANTTKCSGQSITMDVTATGTTPIYYQWYQWGNPISGAVNNFYTLYSINPADSGTYYCIATNSCGTDNSANINLKVNVPVSVYKQSRDTSKCVGDVTLFNVLVHGSTPVNYSWYFEEDSIVGAHSNTFYIDSVTQDHSGNYFCKMTNICGTIDGGNKELIVRPLPVIQLGNDTTFCLGGSIDLSADGPYYCKWNTGSTRSLITVTHSGTFFVHVTDPYGCKNFSDTINITVLEPYTNEILCVVTVDPVSGKNLLAWERTRGYRTASYNIYKETSQTGVYQKIGSLPFDSLSVLIDSNSNPRKKSDRYAITVVDSCGNESAYSPFHKSIHLTANKGTSGENNLSWNHYEGFAFNTYKIYRGTSPSTLVLLDSVASNLNSYSDLTPPSGVAYYQIAAVKLDTCYPDITRAQTNSGPYSQSISNLKDYTQVAASYISASPVESYIGWKEGSSALFNIYTNLNTWEAATTSNWLTLVKDYQNNILKAVAFENYSAQPRSDTVRISGLGVAPQYVIVHQDGTTGILEISPDIHLMVYPNPFNYSTNIEYELRKDADVTIEVYNIVGSRVATVIDQHQLPGKYNYSFNEARTDGIYILRIVVNNNTYIKKLIKTE